MHRISLSRCSAVPFPINRKPQEVTHTGSRLTVMMSSHLTQPFNPTSGVSHHVSSVRLSLPPRTKEQIAARQIRAQCRYAKFTPEDYLKDQALMDAIDLGMDMGTSGNNSQRRLGTFGESDRNRLLERGGPGQPRVRPNRPHCPRTEDDNGKYRRQRQGKGGVQGGLHCGMN